MPFTDDVAKPALLDEVSNLRKYQAFWVLIGSLSTVGAVALAPVLLAAAGPAALCVFALEFNKIDVDRVLNDPPRPDYTTHVRARRRRFHGEHLETPLGAAAADFVAQVLTRSAYLEAAGRADERGQEAEAAGDWLTFQTRLSEGQRATERAEQAAVEVARASDRVAQVWSEGEFGFAFRASLVRGPLPEAAIRGMRGDIDARSVISPAAQAYVESTGLVIEGLYPRVPITEADARAVARDPDRALRERARKYGTSASRATEILSRTYGPGREGRTDPRLR